MSYNSTLIIGIVVFLYLATWLSAKFHKIQLATHRKIWNGLLAVFFLISALLGLLLVISLDNKISLAWYGKALRLHVEFGIAMAVVSLFHLGWHLRYYAAVLGGMFKKNKQTENNAKRSKLLLWLGVPVLALGAYLLILARSEPDDDQSREDEETAIQSPEDNDNDLVITNAVADDYEQLKVSSACIGCGRCIRTDPEHFAFNSSGSQAEVISEKNLDTAELDQAISNCPARAIIRS